MKVLIVGVTYRLEPPSARPYTARLAEPLAKRGHAVTVVTGLDHCPALRLGAHAKRSLWSNNRLNGVHVIRAAHFRGTQSAHKRAVLSAVTRLAADRALHDRLSDTGAAYARSNTSEAACLAAAACFVGAIAARPGHELEDAA